MFTGIIENTGVIEDIFSTLGNKTCWISSPLASQLKVDQSLSHDGVCLTVEEIRDGLHRVTAIEETLSKTNIGKWEKGSVLNLERCMQLNGRLDGHIVQGHVDCTAACMDVIERNGSTEYLFDLPEQSAMLVIEKGSITINGISLTVFNVHKHHFTVGVIPYTFEHTNMKLLRKGDMVNLEFDVIGKYVNRIHSLK